MTTRLRSMSHRRVLVAACCLAGLVVLLATLDGAAQTAPGSIAPIADLAPVGPDVTVFSFTDIGNYGGSGGFVGYAVGTVSCNRGDAPLNWCTSGGGCVAGATSKDHPVIAQNLYRLKNGRFEQLGMSWLKHGFFATNSTTGGCSGASGASCTSPPGGGSQLGVGCTDPYSSGLNGGRPLGRRSEVDATTGIFPFPVSSPGGPYTAYDQRIKVATTEVDPALNAGALYWVEGQYIANDDASAGNAFNNASYRRVLVGAGPTFGLSMTGSFFEREPAINAWKAQDASVSLVNVDVPGAIIERFHVGRKVTDLGGGLWHYEYAIHNLNSDRSARAFDVQFPAETTFTNVGFKDVDAHSGEPYSTVDWSVFSSGGLVSWSTSPFATDPNANALRFGTLYNFWFDADQPPTGAVIQTIELFKPGTPETVSFTIGDDLFADGFESGSLSHWTGSGGS